MEMQHHGLGKLKGSELVLNAKGRATIENLEGAGKPPYRVVIAGTGSMTNESLDAAVEENSFINVLNDVGNPPYFMSGRRMRRS